MLCEAGRCEEAVALYHEALRHCPDEALLHFNLARRARGPASATQEALARYEACLRLAPTFADAHYNAARLHEQLGHASQAIRHYSEYRRLERSRSVVRSTTEKTPACRSTPCIRTAAAASRGTT